MNLLNLPDWSVERVDDSARDYRVHATYTPEPGHCQTCGLFARLYHHAQNGQNLHLFPNSHFSERRVSAARLCGRLACAAAAAFAAGWLDASGLEWTPAALHLLAAGVGAVAVLDL